MWSSLKSEPLLWVFPLGILLYLMQSAREPEVALETITVRQSTINGLVQKDADLTGLAIDDARQQELVESYIDDEVLLREAFRRGLHETDPRVRKRLLNVMLTGLTSLVPEPSRAQLEAYYADNPEVYREPETVDFIHVSFRWGGEPAPTDPVQFRAELNAGQHLPAENTLDPNGGYVRKGTRRDLVNSFGADFADAIAELPLSEWRGPVESFYGIHYVKLTHREEAFLPELDQIENYLRQRWVFEQTRAVQKAKIDELRVNYQIVIQDATAQ